MKTALLILCLSLGACATQSTTQTAAPDPDYYDHHIQIQTLPPGAIIDWNNDVVGVSPCEVVVKNSYKGRWPINGYARQIINARWTDGSRADQIFSTGTPIPKHLVFLHPIPSHIAPPPATLTQR